MATGPVAALFTGANMIPLSEFPAIDATLNATSALLLSLGYFFIRRKRIQAHKACMLSAFATSSLFLGCVVVVPLILTTLCRAWRGRFERHKKIARWTLPLWLYVSVTGVIIYWMLYHLHAQVAAR